ncbi:ABC transporter permease [[Clostridium] polysaccharolyticum]|jgi:tungstate transport system permease protein|uniref:Tungstate transport system permease protein n=1 Tax=[Clostridium] polysaccharolyticum TaxID=29364 RepID=A0A1I0EDQ5_9FIRM|nr:ABC transporter permease [[Clostridium] polysaccharolyticum]SET43180.1 tungstate transport system permease protein [[Clostridium] polysaccharolyticum]
MWIEIQKAFSLLFGQDDELRQILFLTLKMSLFSTGISTIAGVTAAVLSAVTPAYPIKRYAGWLINTLMGTPPVAAGLIVFLMLSRNGPLGQLGLLYTIDAMVIAQVFLIAPIVTGLSSPVLEKKYEETKETFWGLNIGGRRKVFLLLQECRKPLAGIILSAFGRSIAEVGAVQLVGGNVQYKTRVMTTAIMLETNRGNFQLAVSLGMVLLLCSFIVNSLAGMILEK